MNNLKNNIISDINTFDKEASIYKILFQDRTTALLKYIVEKISIDKYERVNYRLPSILIAGQDGKQIIIRAFSNSLCCKFEHIQGKHLGMGGCCGSLYRDSDSETVYFIGSADKLNATSVTTLHNFLTHGYVKFKNPISGEEITVSAENKLFVFSVRDPAKLCPDLHKAVDYHCYLNKYNIEQMEILVEFRLKWCGVDFDKEVPAIIVRNGAGSISHCIRLLSVCFLVMRGNGKTKMTVKDVETGIALSHPQKGIVVPSADDIPF